MPLPKNINDLTDAIESSVDDYGSGLDAIQKAIYQKVMVLLKDLTTDAEGNIKTTVSNYKIITKVKNIIKKELNSDAYIKQVSKVDDHYANIKDIQDSYFTSMFDDYTAPAVLAEFQKQAINDTIESLTGSGINEILVNKATDIVGDNIRSGRNFTDMTDELEEFILGNDKVDGKLIYYSKQIMNDSLSQYAGNYSKIITDDLDLQWFGYVGGLVRDSRQMCRVLVAKKYIHISEIKGICRGEVDGKEVSTAGMIPGTDENNFQELRCGFNCGHQAIPLPKESVPQDIRDKFEEETDNTEE